MVIISNYAVRKNSSGESFVALILNSGVEMAKSAKTGKFYANSKTCSIPSTISEEVAKALVGTKMPGSIERIPCDPYEYITSSGETIELDFTYEYRDSGENVEENVFKGE